MADGNESESSGNLRSAENLLLPPEKFAAAENPEESSKRKLSGWQYYVVAAIAIIASCFHLYTAAFGLFDAMTQRSWHWMFMGTLLFLCNPAAKKRPKNKIDIWDCALAMLLIVGCANILINFEAIAAREGNAKPSDIYLGVIMIVLVVEGTRRSMGWPLPIMAMIALIYGMFGPYFPGLLAHAGFGIDELVPFMYLRTDGIFGVPLGVSASFIFLFVLFGSFLSISGAGQFFIDLAIALTGSSQGGPGKAAVVACASTGGQVMPPVMGAAAFIMAQFLSVSYWEIVVAAAIPATLYFLSIVAMVHFYAGKAGMPRLNAENLPRVSDIMRRGWHLLLPIVLLIIILAFGYSPTMAVFYAIIALVAASWLGSEENRMTPKRIVEAMISGGVGAVDVAAACACSGIVIGVIAITGVGLAFSSFVLSLSGGILPMALFLTMLGSIILGMGVPTTAQYIITSTLAAPALHELGVPMMSAHLFCLYFGVLADVTPPVALATYAAAGIARSNAIKTGFMALVTAAAGFVVPYMFVYNPYLLLRGDVFHIVAGSVTALIGIIGLASAVQGYLLTGLNIFERLLIFTVPFCIIHPSFVSNIAGVLIIIAIFLKQKRSSKKKTPMEGEAV